MTDKEMDKLQEDLEKICKKHGIRNMAFTGSCKKHYIGIMGRATLASLFETALNVGRLWQHVRTVVRGKLDDYDKKIK